MNRFLTPILRHPACTLLAIWFLFVLMVPNVALCVTESMNVWAGVTNIILPLGFYMLLVAAFKRTGWAVIAMLPFSILAAFQIVLLFLYGGSIIAVDMFLNVVTTNMSEASELLENLGTAILVVVILYLPPIIWGIVTLCRRKVLMPAPRRYMALGGVVLFLSGIGTAAISEHKYPRYEVANDIFPANVIYNIKIAVDRTIMAERYVETSRVFDHESRSIHADTVPEIYVMVIGETSRALNWQLGGYGRETNPRLSERKGITFFDHALSESNTTHKSVPMLMSCVTATDFDSIGNVKSIIDAYSQAGFKTTFISNQAPNHSYTEFFGREADDTFYLTDTLGRHRYDEEMLPYVAACIDKNCNCRQLIVLHSYGSHFKYEERYPQECACFKPDYCKEVSSKHRDNLVNAYDNSIRYTDYWLDRLITMIEQTGRPAALMYASDHGEDLMDDDRSRFLHASPTPTYYQLHVAMFTWLSPAYMESYPEKGDQLQAHKNSRVSSTSSVYNTLLDLSGIESPYLDRKLSLASDVYESPAMLYVNDKNEGVDIRYSGMHNSDFYQLHMLNFM